MDENWRDERFPLANLLAIRRELKTKGDYIATGGHGDCLEGQLICNVPTPTSSSSSASLLEFQEAPDTTPSFCDDQSMWNRGDYEFNIGFLTRSESDQSKYITCQKEKYARNNTLLAHIRNLVLQELENCERKKTELDTLNTECDEYKRKINENLTLQSKLRFEEEEKLNKDLKEQKRMLLELRRRIKTGGRDHHSADNFSQHKRLQDKEHGFQKTRLQQRVSDCSFTATDDLERKIHEHAKEKFRFPCIKKDNEKLTTAGRYEPPEPKCVSYEKSQVAIVLPHINSNKTNLVCRAEVGNGQGDDWYNTNVGKRQGDDWHNTNVGNGQGDDWYNTNDREMLTQQKDTLPDHQQKT